MNTIAKRAATDRILQIGLWTFLAGVLLCVFAACAIDDSNITPEQAAEYHQLQKSYDDALAAGVPEAVERSKAELRAFEDKVYRERAGPIISAISAVPVVGPWAAILSPFLLGLAPLIGKRGRTHAKSLVQNLNPLHGGSINWQGAWNDLGKYLGATHSSEASKAAAESNA